MPSGSTQVEALSVAGFSGASIWRVRRDGQSYALRCWPQGVEPKRLHEQHAVLRHVQQQGLNIVPVPIPGTSGQSCVEFQGRWWQLEPWMPGIADYWKHPSIARLEAAFRALAQWHVAAATYPRRGEWMSCRQRSVVPTIQDRLVQLQRYSPTVLNELEAGLCREPATYISDTPRFEVPSISFNDASFDAPWGWRELGTTLVNAFRAQRASLRRDLETMSQWQVDIQPVMRDVWHDHVLFTNQDVSGLIDYGAARTDSVVVDLARLLTSLIGHQATAHNDALNAYESIRRLSDLEHRMLPALSQANVLLSGLTWLRRRYLDRIPIADEARVLERLSRIVARLVR